MEKRLMMFLVGLFLSLGTALAQTEISGTVVSSSDGQPVVGASILVSGTQNGTVTDIDELGLDAMDVSVLRALCQTFHGRPVGLTTLASAVSEDPSTLEDVYEPFLLQQGLIIRTPQGRQATQSAFNHLNIPFPSQR